VSKKHVTRNPVTGTIRVPVGKSYNVCTGHPTPKNGCAVVALGMVALPTVPALWAVFDWLI
jgi:hypothetical protein